MWKILLLILGSVIVLALSAYAIYLLIAVKKQKKVVEQAYLLRVQRLHESIEIIAEAMERGDCNLSEGVLRLKMLLEPLGKKLKNYSAMYALYEIVADMPTHEARRELKKNERMRLDLQRETAEADLEDKIKLELQQLLKDLKN